MKILFVIPRVSETYHRHVEAVAVKGWGRAGFLKRDLNRNRRTVGRAGYGTGLLTLITGLPPDVEPTLIDENFSPTPAEEAARSGDFDLVAVSVQLIQADRARELIGRINRLGLPVVVGGPHPTTFPDEYRAERVSLVIGEGEESFGRFLADFRAGRPAPVYRRGDLIDLTETPAPAFALAGDNRYQLVGVQTTRGCPYRCKFCNVSHISGSKYRHKPIEAVVREVGTVKKLWPDSFFFFYDDNTYADPDYAAALMTGLQGIDLGHWVSHADVSLADNPELLRLIAANGDPLLSIGFETLSPARAKEVGNPMKAKWRTGYAGAIARMQAHGARVGGSFIFGFPGDAPADLETIYDFIDQTGIQAYVTVYTAIPGSRLYDELAGSDQASPQASLTVARTRQVNARLRAQGGWGLLDLEDILLAALVRRHPDRLPLTALDNLATHRMFLYPYSTDQPKSDQPKDDRPDRD